MDEVSNIGTLFKNLREGRGLTQKEVARKVFIDATTLSKIESNQVEPSSDMLKIIMQFFGLSPRNSYERWMITQDYSTYCASKILDNQLFEKKYVEAEKLISALENSKLKKKKLFTTYLMGAKASIWIETGVDKSKIRDLLLETLHLTRDPFEEQKISEYRLIYSEITSINRLAVVYTQSGDVKKGIKVLLALKKSIENTYIDGEEKMRALPRIYSDLATWRGMEGEYGNAIELCEIAERLCIKYDKLTELATILHTKGASLAYLKRKDESRKALTRAYYLYMVSGREAMAQGLIVEAKQDFKLTIPSRYLD